MLFEFNWFSQPGVNNVINMVYKVLDILRIVVPIVLIAMTTIDITKKIIDPSEKEGQKKIMVRAIAAIIVFLIPTILNFTFKILGIELNDKKIDNGGNKLTPIPTSAPIITTTPNNELRELSIINCPLESTVFHNNDTLTLSTDIINSYTGNINWKVISGKKYVTIKEIQNKNAVLNISNIEYDTEATIQLEAGGLTTTCKIRLETEKLSSIKFLNCPDHKINYKVGDKVELKTNIPNKFNGKIKWKADVPSAVKISNNNSSAIIEILDHTKLGTIYITVIAGESAQTCYFHIIAVDELKITNCPSENQIYHVGDKFILKSNLPSYFKSSIIWNNSLSPSPFKFTPSSDRREVEVEIINVPSDNYAFVALAADSKSTACKINIR